ncbi:hypothetical protein GQ607_017861 [Colletotrichum asianum]|uniref:F-box domain-containing protein n=1 Tax=Colletotrichum asianum TaxID=702518 RepID=A0A8H3VY95_9PEZI|nr:hypothetical protein GQ607_017861 [Colletotrichum asianum]
MARFTDLPSELVVQVAFSLRRKDIVNFMLTSKRMHAEAIPALWSDVRFQRLVDIRQDSDLEKATTFLKRLTMTRHEVPRRAFPQHFARFLRCTFPQLRCLHNVVISVEYFDRQLLGIIHKERITELGIIGWDRALPDRERDITDFLDEFINLESLTLSFSWNREPYFTREGGLGWPRLRNAVLRWESCGIPIGLQQTLSRSKELQNAAVHVRSIEDIEWISSFVQLTSLRLGFGYADNNLADLTPISKLTKLERLIIYENESAPQDSRLHNSARSTLWGILRPLQSLVYLNFGIYLGIDQSPGLLDDFAHFMPGLQTLRLPFETFVPSSGQGQHRPTNPIPALRKLFIDAALTINGHPLGSDPFTDDRFRSDLWRRDNEQTKVQLRSIFPMLEKYWLWEDGYSFTFE